MFLRGVFVDLDGHAVTTPPRQPGQRSRWAQAWATRWRVAQAGSRLFWTEKAGRGTLRQIWSCGVHAIDFLRKKIWTQEHGSGLTGNARSPRSPTTTVTLLTGQDEIELPC